MQYQLWAYGQCIATLEKGKVYGVGRYPTNIIHIRCPTVSRVHAEITVNDHGVVELEDLDSSNGTWVEGQVGHKRVMGKVLLREGDIVMFGKQITVELRKAA